MDKNRIVITHSGRSTTAEVLHDDKGLVSFRQDLENRGFIFEDENHSLVKGTRKLRFFSNDWPMDLVIKRHNGSVEISIAMYIPWSWLIITVVALATVPPLVIYFLAGFSGWTLFGLTILCIVFIGVTFLIILKITGANPKQKFDVSPKAAWQRLPRRRWNKNFVEMFELHFKSRVKQL